MCTRANMCVCVCVCVCVCTCAYDGGMSSCTSSFDESCAAVLVGTGLEIFFSKDRRTVLDDVEQAKPDPEPYRRAAGTIDLPTSACVALEDSASGVQSAVAAGYGLVIGVLTTTPEEDLRAAGAHMTFASTIAALDFLLCGGSNKTAGELRRSVAKL